MISRLYAKHNLLLFALLLFSGAIALFHLQTMVTAQHPDVGRKPDVVDPNPDSSVFEIKNYGGKCLDFGAPPQVNGAPVFIYECNGTIAQEVRLQEVNEFSRRDPARR